MKALITGVSSGLGWGLAQALLGQGAEVYGFSRRKPISLVSQARFHFAPLDLENFESQTSALQELLEGVPSLDLVLLNAGVLGEIKRLQDTSLAEMQPVMQVNLWANKLLLDWLLPRYAPRQVVAISSGAAVNGNKGWGAYSLSKAALNMLIKLYAAECPGTHFCALAPGLVDTAMQDYLCSVPDPQAFPSVQKLKAARHSPAMPGPQEAGAKLVAALPRLLHQPSGAFVDLREMA